MNWEIELPYPPSGNHRNSRNGKATYRPAGTIKYFADVVQACREQSAPQRLSGRLSARYVIQAPDNRRRDLDNAVKTLNDAITEAGVWLDDYQIDELQVYRMRPVRGGRVLVRISELPGDTP